MIKLINFLRDFMIVEEIKLIILISFYSYMNHFDDYICNKKSRSK